MLGTDGGHSDPGFAACARILPYLPQPVPFSVIADKLGISRSAAKDRAERLYQRLGVHSRDEAVSRARELGLLRR